MDKKRKWQFPLILAVIALTVYNILPTLFFYTKPLSSPVSKTAAEEYALTIASRVDKIEEDSIAWLHSYCRLLGIKPHSIATSKTSPDLIEIQCAKSEDAKLLRKYLPRAGLLIPFAPAQLGVAATEDSPKEVTIQRKMGLHLVPLQKTESLFTYIPKEENGALSLEYRTLLENRFEAVTSCLTSPIELPPQTNPLLALASSVLDIATLHEHNPAFAGRLAARLAKTADAPTLLQQFTAARDECKTARGKLAADTKEAVNLEQTETKLASAEAFLKKRSALFTVAGPVSKDSLHIELEKANPFFHTLEMDETKNQAILHLHPDLETTLQSCNAETSQLAGQLLIDEVARITRVTNEKLSSTATNQYAIALQDREDLTAVLSLNLEAVTHLQEDALLQTLRTEWTPKHTDLKDLPIVTKAEYEQLTPIEKSVCLIVDCQNGSLYVTAKGVAHLLRAYEGATETLDARAFLKDFQHLVSLLASRGFTVKPGENTLFELRHSYAPLLAATREHFKIVGSHKLALLELSNIEHHIISQNKIASEMHEDLLKWSDEYTSAQVSINSAQRYDVPEPTANVFWSNCKLSLQKLLRGDEKKILRWGLDLSGGKSVQIELRDQSNQLVTDEESLKQGINELFNRVNKMGVSDVSIRRIGNNIELNFPGSQALSASELVKASSMMFHVVNEKFSLSNPSLAETTDRFLQEVWNEATVTQKQDPESVQAIAAHHLYSESRSAAAGTLFEQGLRLADLTSTNSSKSLDESQSMVAIQRETNHTHPLLITFRNHVLEGSDLTDVRSNYDPSKGNYLSFDVQGSAARSALLAWTSTFSKEKVLGTAKEAYSRGHGWRMAVLLNGSVISSPTLESPLQGSAQISGSFTQREINQLTADLKAGSLTFTPRILSEKNISPELGKTDRMKGIFATAAALILVIASMLAYYRFAGLVASAAVLFNLLILWAVLQNLGASLSLAGIAGIILTVGMAVDANVLVFERMKEEFALSGRISAAIQAGYEKAFSAILDSNVTTIIAALILLNFDAGPIKAFAIAMIIGIASSMFTALFMTRVYFQHWLGNPKHTKLSMASWIRASNFDFLKKARVAFAIAALIIGLGGALLITNRSTLFGMDFTGGYSLQVDLEKPDPNLSEKLSHSLAQKGAEPRDFHIRVQNSGATCQILLGTAMELEGKPFYAMPLTTDTGANPRIEWTAEAIENAGLTLSAATKQSLASNWTAMSGQMSESMRNNALLGLGLALLAIFVYISFRFEYKYAIATLLCLLHDVLITLGSIGLLHTCGVPLQIDLNTIAALMTIIGYSLNDTIIIFDRIREDTRFGTKSMPNAVNLALNATLSRTTITSGTTLLVLLALLIFGGASIFSFALVMTLGVVFGTLSSWFIASPLMLFFHRKEEVEVEILSN
jgi:SecD/SecF fusion protein